MNETEFQERFEGLCNDYEYDESKGRLPITILRKMYKLIGRYLKDYDMYKNKNLQNGAD